LNITLSKEEIEHFLVPRENVIDSYVVEDSETKLITDFFSFYSLPSSILKHVEHKTLKAAYSYYNVPNKHSLTDLTREALILGNLIFIDVISKAKGL
jgi:glycylpeptide N-tetradecanoyltransferase